MGTFMVWVARQPALPGPSCHTVSLVRWTASASKPPAGPGASVEVPAGRAGSDRHAAPAPVMASPRLPVRTSETAPPGPNDADASPALWSGTAGDSAQCTPLPADQAASRLASGPVPVFSSAALP